MRNLRTAIATAIAALGWTAVAATAAPAHADYPGACLVWQNHSGRTLDISMNYPAGHDGAWTVEPGDYGLVSENHVIITSNTGHFNVTLSDSRPTVWNYDPYMNRKDGCNGAWILTIN
ncbi:hypothetical protein OHB26_20105 [Nocardia sp. NBC_01503]|uniref:hypothetical protein n=1 Tax=Nocardia sp. NBC_01503 TaxID=2975997 RepID=UPI002E7ACBB3|nr:hypothetical protein [Nocardia sp. NBC_01503]WTL29319.1 hypothetical protein OHB26_20105 [Nocardia sp. NBC_01503]